MSQTPENTGNMTTYSIPHPNLMRRLLTFTRRSENRQPTRFSPQRQSRRHEIFEPDSGNYKYIIPDKDFVRIPLTKEVNVDPITYEKFNIGNKALEFGIRKKRYMSLKSLVNYIQTEYSETFQPKSKRTSVKNIQKVHINSNKTMLKNVITRELLKRKDIRFVKFVKN